MKKSPPSTFKIENTISNPIVVIIGPIEFSTKAEKRKEKEKTTLILKNAKTKANPKRHKTSSANKIVIVEEETIIISPVPKIKRLKPRLNTAINRINKKVYIKPAINLDVTTCNLETGRINKSL